MEGILKDDLTIIEEFLSTIPSKATRKNYGNSIRKFEEYLEQKHQIGGKRSLLTPDTRYNRISDEEINRISGEIEGGNCISLYRGDFKTLELNVTDENGAYDLTGCILNFYLKKKVTDYDTNALISKSSNQSSEIKITDLTNGLAEIYVPADTENLAVKLYIYAFLIWSYKNKPDGKELHLNELYLVCSGKYRNNAIKIIESTFEKNYNVHYLDGSDIADLRNKVAIRKTKEKTETKRALNALLIELDQNIEMAKKVDRHSEEYIHNKKTLTKPLSLKLLGKSAWTRY